MKTKLKRIIGVYFNSWWLPAAVALLVLGILILTIPESINWKFVTIVAVVKLALLGLTLLGVLFVSVYNLVRKRWAIGIINLLKSCRFRAKLKGNRKAC